MNLKVLLLTLLLPINIAFSQSNMFNAFSEAEKIWEENKENYYNPINYLDQINSDSLSSIETSIYYDALATYSSLASDFDKTLECDIRRRKARNSGVKYLQGQNAQRPKLIDAKAEIIKLAASHKVIMINESHHTPYHRIFISDLLEGLYDKGYRYLALEALEHDHQINEIGYPVFEDGFYIREPLFGEMIRKAHKLKFKLVAYESKQKCDKKSSDRYYCQRFRDSIQAVNINKILEQDAGAKILVLAGYSHIKENREANKTRMAGYFQIMSGINPLTINQTDMMDFGDTTLLNPFYKEVMQSIKDPTIKISFDGNIYSNSDQVDIDIFSPPLSKKDDRYTFYNSELKTKFLPKKINQKTYSLQAFYKNEEGNNIPADQLIIKSKNQHLYLEAGKYVILQRDRNGKVIEKSKVKIR